jgi:hypothetical protein
MAKAHCTQYIINHGLKVVFTECQALPLLHENSQINFLVFHDQKNCFHLCEIYHIRYYDINQLWNKPAFFILADLPEVGHDLYLSDNFAAVVIILLKVLNQLDGNILPCRFAVGLDHRSKTSLTNFLDYLIFSHHI